MAAPPTNQPRDSAWSQPARLRLVSPEARRETRLLERGATAEKRREPRLTARTAAHGSVRRPRRSRTARRAAKPRTREGLIRPDRELAAPHAPEPTNRTKAGMAEINASTVSRSSPALWRRMGRYPKMISSATARTKPVPATASRAAAENGVGPSGCAMGRSLLSAHRSFPFHGARCPPAGPLRQAPLEVVVRAGESHRALGARRREAPRAFRPPRQCPLCLRLPDRAVAGEEEGRATWKDR